MEIEIVTRVDEELLRAFKLLVPQLTDNHPPPSLDDLQALVRGGATTLMIARGERGTIIGALSLAVYRVPTGVRAIIEDVIVDDAARGQGIGELLIRRAIEVAKEQGAGSIALTSNPRRAAANRLYERVGFIRRETNAYTLRLSKK